MDLLSAEAERALLERAQAGDRAAVETLIQKNQRLVFSIANRHFFAGHGGDQELDDVVQWGMMGLLRAVEKWNGALGIRFSTYAVPWIRAYVWRFGTVKGNKYGISYRDSWRLTSMRGARVTLMQSLGREAMPGEIAAATGLDLVFVEAMLPALDGIASLDEARYSDGEDDDRVFYDLIPADDAVDETAENHTVFADLCALIQDLPDRAREVISRRYLTDSPDTYQSIGKDMGVTSSRVQQIEQEALALIRARYET